MRTTGVKQENNQNSWSAIKAGAAGAVSGALICRFAPLTTTEHDFYLNSSAKETIKQKVLRVRTNEVQKIAKEYNNNLINLSGPAFDTFERHEDVIINAPEKASESIKDAPSDVKKVVKSLIERVEHAGKAKEHVEIHSIKTAAKSKRPMAFFAITAGLLAMSIQIGANLVKQASLKKAENKASIEQPEQEDFTMADVLLEGLGSNTEILYLSKQV